MPLTDIIGDGHRISDVIDGIRAFFRKLDQRRQPVDMNGTAFLRSCNRCAAS